MIITTKAIKDKYEQIQNFLFEIIPEKWEEIYLYASVIDEEKKLTGELYFYYLPKGFLKKKFINVYEVPVRFNIKEEEYIKLVTKLYDLIKSLRQDFIESKQKTWNDLTIIVANCKFKIEYGYDEIKLNEEETKKRHIIWKYKYMRLGGEIKEEKKILDDYFSKDFLLEKKKEKYQSGMYEKKVQNVIDFEKEHTNISEIKEDETIKLKIKEENKIEKKQQPNVIQEEENIIFKRLYQNKNTDINTKKEGSNKQ